MPFGDSDILKILEEQFLVWGFIGQNSLKKPVKLYQGTKHGFRAVDFHSRCDNKGATITIVRTSTGNIFGGYASLPWGGGSSYTNDSKAFLFSVSLAAKYEVTMASYALQNNTS